MPLCKLFICVRVCVCVQMCLCDEYADSLGLRESVRGRLTSPEHGSQEKGIFALPICLLSSDSQAKILTEESSSVFVAIFYFLMLS